MRFPFLKRRSFYIPFGIAVVLGILSVIVFNPDFQKSQLLKRLGPAVDSLEIGRVHITPWSTEFDDVSVGYEGGEFHVDAGRIRYGLGSLIFRKINVKLLSLQGVRADLTSFNPPEKADVPDADAAPAAPFAGLLATLETGFGYVLGEIEVDADARLPAGQLLTAVLSGGNIRPETTGKLGFDLRLQTGSGDDHVDLDGSVLFDQLTRGRFNVIEATLVMQAALASLPQAERVAVNLGVSPAGGDAAGPADAKSRGQASYVPESIAMSVNLNDSEGASRATLELLGIYDGNGGEFRGDYRLAANEQLVQPYAADQVIAPANETLSGEIAFNLASLTGDMTVNSELLVTELQTTYGSDQLPERLQMQSDFRVSVLADGHLRIDKLETAVGTGELPAMTSNLAGDQTIALDDVGAFLRQDNTLLSFELPGIPLVWLNFLLPGYEVADGALTGAFVVTTDTAGSIYLKPQRPLTVAGLKVSKAGQPLFDSLNIELSPVLSYTGESLRLALEQLEIRSDQGVIATADTTLDVPLSGAQDGRLDVDARAQIHLRDLTRILEASPAGRPTLPETLDLTFKASVMRQDSRTQLERLDADLLASGGNRLVRLALLQPITFEETPQGSRVANSAGELATFNVSDIDLGWFSAFVPGGSLAGMLRRADFTLAVNESGTVAITPDRPFRAEAVTMATASAPLLDNIGVRVSPVIRIGTDRIDLSYQDLELAGDGVVIASGSGTVRLGRADGTLVTEGRVDADLMSLARQPLVASLLGAELNAPVRFEADYRLAQDADGIDISRLAANVFYDDAEPKIAVLATSRIRVRTRLAAEAPAAGQARGELALTIRELTAQPFADILAARGLSFSTANGQVVLSSDGNTMRVATEGPLEISGIAVRGAEGSLVEPFSVALDVDVDVQGKMLTATLDPFSASFANTESKTAVLGKASIELDGAAETVRVSSLVGEVAVWLPAILGQPALMPGNKLTDGNLRADLDLAADGRVASTVVVDGLKAGVQLPLESINATLGGTLNTDGSFALTTPVTVTGKSGTSAVDIQATRGGLEDSSRGLAISASGAVLYLNDILNTLHAIAGQQPVASPGGDADAPVADEVIADNRQPDLQPFWSQTGEGLAVNVDVQQLFYTDYFVLDGLTVRTRISPQRVALENLRANFHDSPMAFDGTLDFAPGPAPYDLKLTGRVDQLDLATFYRELAPDSKPRAEGLFDFRIDAFGQSPNMPQFRNELFFDMSANSRDGVFRLLDPDSAIVASSTGFTGALGEVVSYVPTGLFGLGAVPRLVRYIKEIQYDRVRVELIRGESRDVQVRQFVVQSDEVLMTGSGGIEYQEGTDILQSPLALEARLDMRGEGAAIMYDMDLLGSEMNRWNYWEGPEIRFWGTPAIMQSNLSDVISQAGKGMVFGGVSRPVSGLIGNARHRWSSEKEPPLEYDGSPDGGAQDALGQSEDLDESADLPVSPDSG